MGCDIHGTIEVKHCDLGAGDGLWYTVVKLDDLLPRDYHAFSHLFGVRTSEDMEIGTNTSSSPIRPKELFKGRGLPHDIADTTRREYDEWGPDAHSETWAYHHEIESAVEGTELGTTDGSYRREAWIQTVNVGRLVEDLKNHPDSAEDGQVRWVVWFDN